MSIALVSRRRPCIIADASSALTAPPYAQYHEQPVFRAVYQLSLCRVVEGHVFPHILRRVGENDGQIRATQWWVL